MEDEDEKNFEIAAYHESGHVVFTYLSGYSCEWIELSQVEPGSGVNRADYGDDVLLVAGIKNSITNPSLFNELEDSKKSKGLTVARKISKILLAGSAAQFKYLKNANAENNLEIFVSGDDLLRMDNIEFFLSQIQTNPSPDYTQNTLTEVLNIISHPKIWSTIEMLSRGILISPDKQMNKMQIEKILNDSGFTDFIKEKKQ
jgi:hypothetical protein